jgi:hypothetical protein
MARSWMGPGRRRAAGEAIAGRTSVSAVMWRGYEYATAVNLRRRFRERLGTLGRDSAELRVMDHRGCFVLVTIDV